MTQKTITSKNFIYLLLLFTLTQLAFAQGGINGPGVDNTARPAGTKLKFVPLGGRMVTFHRGYLYIMGQGKTTLWDVSDATDPKLLFSENYGDNGHRWWKLNTNIFWREYSIPEIKDSGYRFLDMSNMFDLKPWTNTDAPLPIQEGGHSLQKWQQLETFPTGTSGGNIHDLRYDNPTVNPDAITAIFNNNGAEGSLRFRIGHLLFTTTGNGISVLDIGDPENVRFLDAMTGSDFQQYTTTYHVWRDKIVFLSGTDGNLNNNNMAMIDFSDPTDLKAHSWPSGRTGLKTAEMSAGRYMYFQDEFGFTGSANLGVKINMETGEIAQEFHAPGWPETYLDYQWMPLGPTLVASGSNGADGRTFFYQHHNEPDTRGPEIGFHSPFANSTNNPISTVIGFSIPEIIDERTANDQTIQVRAVGGGTPISGDITWNSYHVLNFIPKTMLEPNTTYEVRFIENGLKDVAGNGINEFIFYFSTGDSLTINTSPTITNISVNGQTTPNAVFINHPVSFEINANDEEGDALEYRWDTGNGWEDWGTSNTITETFIEPRIYSISAQVRDTAGGISGAQKPLAVINPAPENAPSQSSQLALDASTRRLLTVNPDNNSLTVIHADSLEKIAEWSVCDGPVSVAIDHNKRAWIACRDSDQLHIINIEDGTTEQRLNLAYGSQPHGVVASPDRQTVYVALSGKGQINAYNADTMIRQGTLTLASNIRAMAIDASGNRLLVTQFISDSNARIWDIHLNTLSVTDELLLINDQRTSDAGNSAGGLPNYLASIAIHPSADQALVASKKDNTDRGLFLGNAPLTFEFTSRSNISFLDLAQGNEQFDRRVDIDNHAQPSAITYNLHGTHAFVTMQGNNRLIVLNPNDGSEIARINTGLAPQAVLIDQDSLRVFVKNFLDRSVSVYDARALLSGESTLTLLSTIDTVANETLSPQVLAGKQLFYNASDPRMTLEGYLSCATCHDDAGHDGRVWDFTDRGEGLRNTIALAGRAGTGHGRVHWTANFDEIQDFEHDIRGAFSGSGFMSNESFSASSPSLGPPKAGQSRELDALAAYQNSLTEFARSPYRADDGTLTESGRRGKAVFRATGCANCHGGPAFTDSASAVMHDIGSFGAGSGSRLSKPLLGLDTPTLRDLWSTAPYLHDGSMPTLEALLESNTGHGFDALSANERRDLANYLRQIDGSEPAFPEPEIPIVISAIHAAPSANQFLLEVTMNVPGVSAVTYYANGEAIAQSTSAPFDAAWTPDTIGDYVLQAKALYNGNNTASLSPELKTTVGPSGACEIRYNIVDNWSGGYRVGFTVINTGPEDISGISLSWNISEQESFISGWNATYESQGNTITASISPNAWNGQLSAGGGSASIGFQLNKPHGSSPSIPNVVTLNDMSCAVQP